MFQEMMNILPTKQPHENLFQKRDDSIDWNFNNSELNHNLL